MCLSGKKETEEVCIPVIFAYIWQQITKKNTTMDATYMELMVRLTLAMVLGRSDRYRA